MKVIVSKTSGYCSGVKRAIKTLDDSIVKFGANGTVFTMGDIIHNPEVIDKYKKMGVFPVSKIDGLKRNDNLVIRSHGVPPEIIEKLNQKGVNVLNATCTFVLKVHKLAEQFSKKGYFLVLIGDKNHPEMIGIKGNITGDSFTIINSMEEAENISPQKKIAILSQTTQTREKILMISKKILEKIKDEVVVLNTTCKAVELRQMEAAFLAEKADIMIVIGGKNSANTAHIAEISKNILPETYHIENAAELDIKWFRGKSLAGVCSGASTPMEDVESIKNIIEAI
jgi:(E)-4-hydroxy-3-methyl-but-2-enyl pyrophosphate reductase